MTEPNNMLDEMEFEAQICKLSGDDLNRFVARQMYATTKRCVVCFNGIQAISDKIGEFDETKKGSLDDRLCKLEDQSKQHLRTSLASGGVGGISLTLIVQSILYALTHRAA